MAKILFVLLFVWIPQAFAWGELGHHLVAKVASKLLPSHPALSQPPSRTAGETAFLKIFYDRRLHQGHLANIPDIYWRGLEAPLKEDGQKLGNSTHYLNLDAFAEIRAPSDFFKKPVPLDYESARTLFHKGKSKAELFLEGGSAPWRAQQFANLFAKTLSDYPVTCKSVESSTLHPTRTALTYAALMSHFTGDASMPLHGTVDYDGAFTGQKGLHWYFENHLVNALEVGLEEKVRTKALEHLTKSAGEGGAVATMHVRAKEIYPGHSSQNEVTALMLVLLADSFSKADEMRRLDLTYAVTTWEEAWALPQCKDRPSVRAAKEKWLTLSSGKEAFAKQKALTQARENADFGKAEEACRRSPDTFVTASGEISNGSDGHTVAQWQEELIVDRLARSAALTADIWAQGWLRAGKPSLCESGQYANKPAFISPTDSNCFGYALHENAKALLRKDGTSVLPWKKTAKGGVCLPL